MSQDKPDEYLPIFEEGAKDALDQILLERGGEDEQDKEVRWLGAEGGRGGRKGHRGLAYSSTLRERQG